MIESLEGKRGTPRNRPPFPVTHGYLNQPTVVNNVETFAAAGHIAMQGGAWFAAIGTEQVGRDQSPVGLGRLRPPRYLRISVRRDGTPDAGGLRCDATPRRCRSAAPPASWFRAQGIRPHASHSRISPTAGAFMVFDQSRDMFEVARNFVHFFAHESCGFCTPCRVGTALLRNLMDKLRRWPRSLYDFERDREAQPAVADQQPLRPRAHRLQPGAGYHAKFRPAYERMPAPWNSSRRSTWTTPCSRRAR